MKRSFHLGDILSITSGYLLSPRHIEGVYDILNFATGDNLYTHQLPRARDVVAPYLLGKYPIPLVEITGLAHEAKRCFGDNWTRDCTYWLVGLCSKLGFDEFDIESMSEGEWLRIDPMKELASMIGEDRIIAVNLGD